MNLVNLKNTVPDNITIVEDKISQYSLSTVASNIASLDDADFLKIKSNFYDKHGSKIYDKVVELYNELDFSNSIETFNKPILDKCLEIAKKKKQKYNKCLAIIKCVKENFEEVIDNDKAIELYNSLIKVNVSNTKISLWNKCASYVLVLEEQIKKNDLKIDL